MPYWEALGGKNKIYGLAYKGFPNILWWELPGVVSFPGHPLEHSNSVVIVICLELYI